MRHVLPALWALTVSVLLLVACGGQSTMPSSPEPPPVVVRQGEVFVGAGDIGLCGSPNPEVTAQLLDVIGGTVFTLGDNSYGRYEECYEKSWGRHRNRTRPSPGNHDYEVRGARWYFDYFGSAAGPDGLGYYDYMVGSWHIISLNSNIPISSTTAQVQWLRSRLAEVSARCTLAYWHHPLVTSGPNGPNVSVSDFWTALYEAHADVILNGHDHLYERFRPQDGIGGEDPERGIRQFTIGIGGAALYPVRAKHPLSEIEPITTEYGVLKLVLYDDSYEWSLITPAGIRDSGSGQCH